MQTTERYWREFPPRLRNGMNVTRVGPIDRLRAGMLSFCEGAAIALNIPPTDGPGLVLCHAGIAEDIERQGHVPSVCDEPRNMFWDFHKAVRSEISRPDRRIDGSVHATSVIDSPPFKVHGEHLIKPIGGVTIAEGATVGAKACIDAGIYGEDTEIHARVHIDNLVHVGHSAVIRAGAKLVAHSGIGGWADIGEGAWIGLGAMIRDGITVGDGAFVGMGSNVVEDVEPNAEVYGNPARFKRWRK